MNLSLHTLITESKLNLCFLCKNNHTMNIVIFRYHIMILLIFNKLLHLYFNRRIQICACTQKSFLDETVRFFLHTCSINSFLLSMLHVSIQRNNKNVSPHQKAEGIYEKIAKSFYFSVILFSVACYATLSSFCI